MKSIPILLMILLMIFVTDVNAEALKKVYLDEQNNVHLVTASGKHRKVTNSRNAAMLKIAPDSETVAWLVLNMWKAEEDERPGAEELIIYHNGKHISIKCTPFIRDYWFWAKGKQVAIDCGGRHFAGREILYDAKTSKEIASFDQADVPYEKRPKWSSN